jgi:hypothetical protein
MPNDIACLRETWGLFFSTILQPIRRQVVNLNRQPDLDWTTVLTQHDFLLDDPGPSFIEACPAMVSLRRLALIFPKIYYTEYYDELRSLYALWPYNLPGLREIDLIDLFIKLKSGRQQKDVALTPSFAGCRGTFYEVNLPPEDEVSSDQSRDLRHRQFEELPWDISALLGFRVAESLRSYYQDTQNYPDFGPATRIVDVKVLAYIPHTGVSDQT